MKNFLTKIFRIFQISFEKFIHIHLAGVAPIKIKKAAVKNSTHQRNKCEVKTNFLAAFFIFKTYMAAEKLTH